MGDHPPQPQPTKSPALTHYAEPAVGALLKVQSI